VFVNGVAVLLQAKGKEKFVVGVCLTTTGIVLESTQPNSDTTSNLHF